MLSESQALKAIFHAAYRFDDKPHQLFSTIRHAAILFEVESYYRDEIIRLMDKAYPNAWKILR